LLRYVPITFTRLLSRVSSFQYDVANDDVRSLNLMSCRVYSDCLSTMSWAASFSLDYSRYPWFYSAVKPLVSWCALYQSHDHISNAWTRRLMLTHHDIWMEIRFFSGGLDRQFISLTFQFLCLNYDYFDYYLLQIV